MKFYGRADEIAMLRKFRNKSRSNAQLVVLTGVAVSSSARPLIFEGYAVLAAI